MGYLSFGFWSLRLTIMLCLISYVLQELQEPDFMFLAMGPGSIQRGQNFFRKKYLSNFFVAKMKKKVVIMSQKLLRKLCIC